MEEQKFSELVRTVHFLKSLNSREIDVSAIIDTVIKSENLSAEQKKFLEGVTGRSYEAPSVYFDNDYF